MTTTSTTTPDPADAAQPHPAPYRPWLGTAHKIVRDLERFQDLVRHHQRWAHQAPLAKPLIRLIPELKAHPELEQQLLEREIDRLIPEVHWALARAGIPGRMVQRQNNRSFDLISDYFQLPYSPDAASFNLVIHALERGIGVYRRRRGRAARELLNPVHWVAALLRLPLRVLELAGFRAPDTLVGRAYGILVQGLVVLLLVLAAARLGVHVPWAAFFGK